VTSRVGSLGSIKLTFRTRIRVGEFSAETGQTAGMTSINPTSHRIIQVNFPSGTREIETIITLLSSTVSKATVEKGLAASGIFSFTLAQRTYGRQRVTMTVWEGGKGATATGNSCFGYHFQ